MKKFTEQINIKLSQTDKDRLDAIAVSLNVPKSLIIRCLIRNSYENKEKIFIKDKQFKDNLIYEHRKIGNNINQIAYSLNYVLKAGLHNQLAGAILDTEQKLEDIQNQLNKLETTIEKRL